MARIHVPPMMISRNLGIAFLATAVLSVAAIFPATAPLRVAYADGNGDQGCTPGYWKQPQHFDS